MAHKRKKKSKGKKILVGVTSALLLTGVATGTMVALDRAEVFASESEKEEPGVSENTTSIEELETKISELEANKAELQNKIASLTSDKETLESEVSSLEQTVVDNQSSINSLNEQITDLDKEIANLESEKAVLEENAVANESRITELNASIESLISEKVSLQAQLSEKENVISDLNTQIANLESQIDSLNSQIEELNKGEYTLTLRNPDITIYKEEVQLLSKLNDVTSLDAEGYAVEYEVSGIDSISAWNGGTYKVYYFNGSGENGAYAVRNVTVLNDSKLDVMYKSSKVNPESVTYLKESGELNIEDFTFNLKSTVLDQYAEYDFSYVSVEDTLTYDCQQINDSNPIYTMEKNRHYNVTIQYSITADGQFINYLNFRLYLNTYETSLHFENVSDSTGVIKSQKITGSDEIEYVVDLFGYEDLTITWNRNDNLTIMLPDTLTQTGEFGMSSQGIDYKGFYIGDSNGNTATLYIDMNYAYSLMNDYLNKLTTKVVGIDYTDHYTAIYNQYIDENGDLIVEFVDFGYANNVMKVSTSEGITAIVTLEDGNTATCEVIEGEQTMIEVTYNNAVTRFILSSE